MGTEILENDILEKDTEKVEKKYKKSRPKPIKKTKVCKVLNYIYREKFVVISFDGYGIRINGVAENPGDEVTVEYVGEIGKPGFKIEMK